MKNQIKKVLTRCNAAYPLLYLRATKNKSSSLSMSPAS